MMRLLGWEFSRNGVTRVKAQQILNGVDDRGWNIIQESFGGAWQRDVVVDKEVVLSNWTVFACMTLIAGDIGKMCIELMQEDENGIDVEVESPAFSPVLKKPNAYQTRQKFMESWVLSKLSSGNTYILKEYDRRNVVTAMHVLDPSRVRPLVAQDGSVYYELQDDDLAGLKERVTIPADWIIHDRMWCLFHPLVGLSPIFACGLAAVQGLKIQGNSAKFFENMSRPSGILTAPAQISDDTAKRVKAEWEKNFGGDNIGRVAVLGDGLHYEGMSVNAVDAQLVDQLKLSAEMICSVFHVPGYKVGVGSTPTYQNAEILNQIYYADCIQVQVESIEALLDEGLGIESAGYSTEFDLDELMRMDSATQVKTLNDAVGGGWMSPNEARKKRNLPPVAGGNLPYLQQQNYSLEALAKRDSGSDPFGSTGAATQAPAGEDEMKAISDRARLEVQAEIAEQRALEERTARELTDMIVRRLAADEHSA